MRVPTGFSAELPTWVGESLADVPEVLPTLEERMRLVHRLAARNPVEGNGGPFASLVVESTTGRVVSVGVNVVLASGISSLHAEVMALSLAQTALGTWQLDAAGGYELVNNWRPCALCFGATMWSGVRRLVVAGSGPELEELTGFDEGPVSGEWAAELERRGIEVVHDVLRAEAIETFEGYRDLVADQGLTVYNPR